MAIVLTNGIYYIATNKNGGIIKTPIVKDAKIFYSVNDAMRKIKKAPSKCRGYYLYDTEDDTCASNAKSAKKKNGKNTLRKNVKLYMISQMGIVRYVVSGYCWKI